MLVILALEDPRRVHVQLLAFLDARLLLLQRNTEKYVRYFSIRCPNSDLCVLCSRGTPPTVQALHRGRPLLHRKYFYNQRIGVTFVSHQLVQFLLASSRIAVFASAVPAGI